MEYIYYISEMVYKKLLEILEKYDKDDIIVRFTIDGDDESYSVFLKSSDEKIVDIKKTHFNKLINLGYDQEFNIG